MHQQSLETIQAAEAEKTRYQCRHIFTDGHRCGSPSLREENFCYFHHSTRRPVQDVPKRRRTQCRFTVRMPEDRTAIQLTLGEVLQKLANNDLDPRRAGLLLYGLQIASLNLPKQDPKADPIEPVTEITIDPTAPTHAPIAPVEEYFGPDGQKKGSAQLLLEDLGLTTEEGR